MPYKLRKAPGQPFYWVVGEDGKHFSNEPMPKEKAKAQLRALYANTDDAKTGKGWVEDVRKALYDAYNEVADMDSASWKKVKSVGDLDSEFWVTQHLPTEAQKYLEAHGDDVIEQVIVRKAPVQAALETALQLFSAGKWEEAKTKMGYDTMFHLSLILNSNTILEKLARINLGKADNPADAEFRVVAVKGRVTLKQLLEKTKKRMGDKFYPYDPFHNNCQDFVDAVLEANKDDLTYDKGDREFVKQSMTTMIEDLPTYLPKFARTITSLGGLTGGANGGDLISAPDLLSMCRESYSLIGSGRDPAPVGSWQPVEFNRELVLYNQGGQEFILAVRGTKEVRDVLAWKPVLENGVGDTSRYLDDLTTVRQWKKRFPGTWHGTGHSLGGAILDNFIAEDLVGQSMSFNPAIEPEFANNPENKRVYFQGDPLLAIFGLLDPRKVVVVDPEPGWISWLFGIDFSAHGLSNFDGLLDDVKMGGGKPDVDVEMLFNALEDLVGGALVPQRGYEVSEERTKAGTVRPPEARRTLRDMELGLRALAHKFGAVGTPESALATFGARVMADDLFEHNTGQAVDYGHNFEAKEAVKHAFRTSRPSQIEELATVNSLMARYGLEGRDGRAQAYRIAYEGEAPPRAPEPVARVAPPAEVRRDVEAERRRAEEERRRREDEEKRRLREAEERRLRDLEEEARRLREEEAREAERKAQEEEERRREAEESVKRAAQEEADRLKREEEAREAEARDRARRETERANAEAARLKLAALEETDEDIIAIKEDAAVRAVLARGEAVENELAILRNNIRRRKENLKFDVELSEKRMTDPSVGLRLQVQLKGVLAMPYGDERQVWTLRSGKFPLQEAKDLRKFIEKTRTKWDALSAEEKRKVEQNEYEGFGVQVGVEHPSHPRDLIPLIVHPEFFDVVLLGLDANINASEERMKQGKEESEEFLRVTRPERERTIAEYEARIPGLVAQVEQVKREARDLEREFERRGKEREALRATAAKGKKKKGKGKHSFLARALGHVSVNKAKLDDLYKWRAEAPNGGVAEHWNQVIQTIAKPTIERQLKEIARKVELGTTRGKGGQHKAFQYSRPDLTKAEKAAERARHYRKVKREKEGRMEVKPGQTRAIVQPPTKVALTEAEKATEASRGLRETTKKATLPKKNSVRKPYVGKKMKESFLEAVKSKSPKDQRNLFNRAKRLYKEGGISWEEVTARLAPSPGGGEA